MNRICRIDGCQKEPKDRSLCTTHAARKRLYGDPTIEPLRIVRDDERRFWSYVEVTGFCWLWRGTIESRGYGRFVTRQSRPNQGSAHRWAYEHLVGPIPAGLQLDHLCRIRNCVNPDHLEPVDCSENLLRGFGLAALNRRKTACLNGHPFTPENIYTDSRGRRNCRVCNREKMRERRRQKRALAI